MILILFKLSCILPSNCDGKKARFIEPSPPRAASWTGCLPELNPMEHLWDEIQEKSFPNRDFSQMKAVVEQLAKDLPALTSDTERVKSISA